MGRDNGKWRWIESVIRDNGSLLDFHVGKKAHLGSSCPSY